MELPAEPQEVSPRPGERVIGHWDSRIKPVHTLMSEIVVRVILTDQRLIVLNLPTAIARVKVASVFSFRAKGSRFMGEMGRWHVILNAALSALEAPVLDHVPQPPNSALRDDLALRVGSKPYYLGDGPNSVEMSTRVHEQWTIAQASPSLR